MSTRKTLIALLAVALLAIPATIAGDEAEGEVALGAQRTNVSDSPNRAAEFESEADGFVVQTWWDIGLEGGEWVELDFAGISVDDQAGSLLYDSGSSWTIEALLNRYVHNLPHDPLDNLDATDEEGKQVYADDFAAGEQFGIAIQESDAALVYRPQHARAWEVALRGRRFHREGTRQFSNTNHCENCHVIGQSRMIDEDIDTVSFLAAYEKPEYGLSYEARVREFNSAAETLSRYYQIAQHPARPVGGPMPWDLFRNRVQYDDTTLPIGAVVENQALTHIVRAHYTRGDHHLDGVAVVSEVESENTGLTAEHAGARVRWLYAFDDAAALTIHGRYQRLSSDDYFVDVNDTLRNSQGPAAGRSYYEVYPDAPGDFLRQSSYDRKSTSGQADLIWRYGDKRRHRFKGSLIANQVDRDHFVVDNTSEFILRALFTGRMGDKTRYRFNADYLTADDPFANIDGAFREPREPGNPPSGNPFSDLQYYDMYRARIGDVTNQPTSGFALKGYFSVVKNAHTAFNVSGKYVDEENDETQVFPWEKDAWSLNASLWWSPSERSYATVTYNAMNDDVWAGISIPVFGG